MKVYKEKSPVWEIIKWYLIALCTGLVLGSVIDVVVRMIIPAYEYTLASVLVCLMLPLLLKKRFRRSNVRFDGCLGANNIGLGFKLAAAFIAYLACIAISHPVLPPVGHIVGSLQSGVMEEMIFRVVPLTIMIYTFRFKEKLYRPMVLITALVFSSFHMTNLLSGANFQATIVQMVSTFGLAVLLAAIYLRSGNAWPLIACHFANNFVASMLTPGEAYEVITKAFSTGSIIVTVITAIACVALGLYYTRDAKLSEISELWRSKQATIQ